MAVEQKKITLTYLLQWSLVYLYIGVLPQSAGLPLVERGPPFTCPKPNGKFPDTTNLKNNTYYSCKKGEATRMTCPFLNKYCVDRCQPINLKCDYNKEIQSCKIGKIRLRKNSCEFQICDGKNSTWQTHGYLVSRTCCSDVPPEQRADECKVLESKTNKEWLDLMGGFTCSKRRGLFPDPTDCHRFIACRKFQPTLRMCPKQLYFNSEKRRCEWENDDSCFANVTNDITIVKGATASVVTEGIITELTNEITTEEIEPTTMTSKLTKKITDATEAPTIETTSKMTELTTNRVPDSCSGFGTLTIDNCYKYFCDQRESKWKFNNVCEVNDECCRRESCTSQNCRDHLENSVGLL
ncbi:unnamed protein product [Owenia fusiformis]|uniref:Uncharacterized protein n=1 Tax=Owenia fusiformis TaxID=6347 RepID=A0A8J1XS50_OWEFU|nr:unnamed protein product [Owenia fusiformis]